MNNERNGKGKQYDWEGKLIFEGEYLNGKKWIGKERKYNDKKLILEVEYLNGKKMKGKVYDKDGKIIYELINGKGKFRDYDGDLSYYYYEGEYLNSEKNGNGKEYNYEGKLLFEGEIKRKRIL